MANYIRLPQEGYAVFVGDTHGDYQAAKIIIKNFINKKGYYIVMLGDYIDRGPESKKNIDFLLSIREKHRNLILLAGNHEMHAVRECSPSDFWDSMSEEECDYYNKALLPLPVAAAGNGFMALHGALPQISSLEDISGIKPGDENWTSMIWGDFRDKEGGKISGFLGRPKFGADYFEEVMERLQINVLIRSHDPLAPERMFNNRCLTLFTSSAYGKERKIALCRLDKEIKTIDDLEIISLDKPEIGK